MRRVKNEDCIRRNIVLTGFMGVGKTTVGKKVAELSGLSFVDTDTLIEIKEKLIIAEIFKKHGQEYFRAVEQKVIADVSRRSGLVVATGGGAVLSAENMDNLRQNGIIIYMQCSIETIIKNLMKENNPSGRPNLKSIEKNEIESKLNQRKKYYSNNDCVVDVSDCDIEKAAEFILEQYNLYNSSNVAKI